MEKESPITGLSMYSQEMEEAAEQYVYRILEALETVKKTKSGPTVPIKRRLDFSDYVLGGFGTADCVILAGRTLHLFDMKYGTSVLVDANVNLILDRSEVNSGLYGRTSVTFYTFNSNGNRGIACGLNNLQKIHDGKPLVNRAVLCQALGAWTTMTVSCRK